MKVFERSNLPESITYNGRVYSKYAPINLRQICVKVLSRKLKNKADLHGNLYKPSVHIFNAEHP